MGDARCPSFFKVETRSKALNPIASEHTSSRSGSSPPRDLDAYGLMLFTGDLGGVKSVFEERMKQLNGGRAVDAIPRDSEEFATLKNVAAQEIYAMRWGPTTVPIYDLLLSSTIIRPFARDSYLNIARWLSTEAKVPVDGIDLSGSTALLHSISTKPSFDPEFAQILYDAGGDINYRNRFGENAGHVICQAYCHHHRTSGCAEEALYWFLSHGGNVDLKESGGHTARATAQHHEGLLTVIDTEDKRRKDKMCCTFCGRDDAEKLLTCGRCKKAKYCDPKGRRCQKMDWPKHKGECEV